MRDSGTPSHMPTTSPGVSPADRLGVTVFFAVIAHLILILGVTFTPEDRPESRVDALDVVLVPWRSAEAAPDRPDHLAQANRDGGGEGAVKARSQAPEPAPPHVGKPAVEAAVAAGSRPAGRPGRSGRPPRPDPERAVEASQAPGSAVETALAPPAPVAGLPASARDVDTATPENRSLAMAALSAEIERKLKAYAERPRRKWIAARTREHEFAAYMDAWRRRIERIGNLHYPDEAVRRQLSGSLLLDVALNSDGTVESVTVRRSSGEYVLDDAAVRIVQLAAPFPAFPENIAEKVDVLHIERTWVFHSDNRFGSR